MEHSITNLGKFLREQGDRIILGDTLYLSDLILKHLDEAFTLVCDQEESQCYDSDVKCPNEDLVRDTKYLHDFLEKVVNVSIIKITAFKRGEDPVDLSKFRNLKILELRNLAVENVTGLQKLRMQLQSISCIRCTQQIKSLLRECGADNTSGSIWEQLHKAVIKKNTLEKIDDSFVHTPWLQVLDLSCNRLRCFEALQYLPNLKLLNLSFNLLEAAPICSNDCSCKLESLILKNNYIQEISGLSSIDTLQELDLTCNSLSSHSTLRPLQTLPYLKSLILIGNPLSFCSQHRSWTAQFLHINTSENKFILDSKPLSRYEKLLVHQAGEVQSLQRSETQSLSRLQTSSEIEYTSSWASQSSAYTKHIQEPVTAAEVEIPKTKKSSRSRKVQEAVITDSIEVENETTIKTTPEEDNERHREHLETKRQIEMLRERFGKENWLSQHGASCLQTVLGLPPTISTSIEDQLATKDILKEEISHFENKEIIEASDEQLQQQLKKEEESSEPNEEQKETIVCCDEVNSGEEDIEDTYTSEENDEPEPESHLFTVHRSGNQQDILFLTIGARHLRERLMNSGQIIKRWSFDILESCELICKTPPTVHLTFQTIRRDYQSSTYVMDIEDAQNLTTMLKKILESRPLSAMNQVAYHCLKCSMEFCQDEGRKRKDTSRTCPGCGSNIVCVLEDIPVPVPDQIPVTYSTGDSVCSPSHSSTGSTASLESSEANSGTRKCESDIEVISNPSQSSIEILEGGIRTPGRKVSKEENRDITSKTEGIAAVQINVSALTSGALGLTESSSSDSVCTTYETHVTGVGTSEVDSTSLASQSDLQSGKDTSQDSKEVDNNGFQEKKATKLFESSFEEIFEGLMQSVDKKLAGSKRQTLKSSTTDNVIEYSFTDFKHVDHRLHLYCFQYLFENELEELVLLLRADAVLQGTKEPFPSLLVLSNKNIFLLKVTGNEGECPEKWLKRLSGFPLTGLKSLFPLPYGQGVGMHWTQPSVGYAYLLLYNQEHTSNVLKTAASDAVVNANSCVTEKVPEHIDFALQHLILNSAPSEETTSSVHLALFFKNCNVCAEKEQTLPYGILVVTESDLILTKPNVQWLFPSSGSQSLKAGIIQKMCNLIEVEVNGCSLKMMFLDETKHQEENWCVYFPNTSGVSAVINSLKQPWEALFAVPLQVTENSKSKKGS